MDIRAQPCADLNEPPPRSPWTGAHRPGGRRVVMARTLTRRRRCRPGSRRSSSRRCALGLAAAAAGAAGGGSAVGGLLATVAETADDVTGQEVLPAPTGPSAAVPIKHRRLCRRRALRPQSHAQQPPDALPRGSSPPGGSGATAASGQVPRGRSGPLQPPVAPTRDVRPPGATIVTRARQLLDTRPARPLTGAVTRVAAARSRGSERRLAAARRRARRSRPAVGSWCRRSSAG